MKKCIGIHAQIKTKALKGDAICIWCVLHTNIQLYTNASKYKICEFHTYNLNWNT